MDGLRLGGKLDRLEDSADERRVVDYKTGNVPSRKSLEAGEQVQLPHYALTVQAQAISYWDLKDEKATTLDGNALDKLCEVLALRLTQLQAGLASGQLLPAHGAPAVCGHCEYSGVCRNAAHLRTSGAAA